MEGVAANPDHGPSGYERPVPTTGPRATTKSPRAVSPPREGLVHSSGEPPSGPNFLTPRCVGCRWVGCCFGQKATPNPNVEVTNESDSPSGKATPRR